MEIREIGAADAKSYLNLLKQLDHETSFMLFEPGERKWTVEDAEKQLAAVGETEQEVILGAETEGKLAGFIRGRSGNLNRNRYCMYVVIGIIQDYNGKGMGTRLFEELENWAKARRIQRLELTVMEHNRPAMYLYEKIGFQVEGMRKQSMFVDGEFVNEFYMAKILEEGGPPKT
ncbi:MAG TPA: GNAT family N-acetyltransferase [Bacillales bacterium]